MTIDRVAAVAGVSASTVSRVLNSAPGIAASTAEAVRRAVDVVAYTPTRRKRMSSRSNSGQLVQRRVAFIIVQQPNARSIPAYDHLLRGVSKACTDLQLDLQVGFADVGDDLTKLFSRQRLDGLILHGFLPDEQAARLLHGIPTVWLMGNPRRPSCGDQVMPDNGMIGQIAAKYLLRRGHKDVVYHGICSGWSLGIRSLAFQQAITDAGGHATVLNDRLLNTLPLAAENLARELADICQTSRPRPTGIFVAEDWLLRSVYAELAQVGLRIGTDVEIVSCNNDRPYLLGLNPAPATIDIRFERIGYLGVQQLSMLLRGQKHAQCNERVRLMVEPVLVEP